MAFAGCTVAASFVVCVGGCATETYHAAHLPPDLVAPPVENLDEIDWSRIANHSVSSELIACGDVLDVTIITDLAAETNAAVPVRVLDDGMAKIPMVGPVQLAGLELEDAERVIAATAVQRQVFVDPYVTVTMNRRQMNQVRVVGPVEEPGTVSLARGDSSLLAALYAAGGLTDAAGAHVEIRRSNPGPDGHFPARSRPSGVVTASAEEPISSTGGPQTIQVNLVEATSERTLGQELRDGDLVRVSKRPVRRVYVTGLVRNAGSYEIPANEDCYLLNALTMAGGRSMPLADRVLILRRKEGCEAPAKIRASVMEAKRDPKANVRLAAGDVISVEETPLTFVFSTLQGLVRVGMSSSLPLF
jgi:polysaccharide export outer membrane protein